MLRAYCLHGFLGFKEDWDALISYLPEFECIPLKYPFEAPPDSILIGYSMGGRIALQHPAAVRIILSSHPGLATKAEKEERWSQDLKWIEMLKTKSMEEFLEAWHQQPLLHTLRAHKNFPEICARRLKYDPQILIDQLTRHSLAKQTHQIPSNTLFMYGENDLKYSHLYNGLQPNPTCPPDFEAGASAELASCKSPDEAKGAKLPLGKEGGTADGQCRLLPTEGWGTCWVAKIKECGHAIHLENPKSCAEAIRSWLLHRH